MAIQLAVATRNSRLSAISTAVGGTATLQVRSGAPPADAAAADTGTLLCTITLPGSPFAAPSAGAMAKAGTWSGTASAAGTAGHFRIKAAGSTTIIQGTIGQGSGDMSFDNTTITNGQTITISTYTLTDANS